MTHLLNDEAPRRGLGAHEEGAGLQLEAAHCFRRTDAAAGNGSELAQVQRLVGWVRPSAARRRFGIRGINRRAANSIYAKNSALGNGTHGTPTWTDGSAHGLLRDDADGCNLGGSFLACADVNVRGGGSDVAAGGGCERAGGRGCPLLCRGINDNGGRVEQRQPSGRWASATEGKRTAENRRRSREGGDRRSRRGTLLLLLQLRRRFGCRTPPVGQHPRGGVPRRLSREVRSALARD